MELKLGIMTNREIAQWFGIKESSFKNKKKEKLEELKLFAKFEEERGKINILEIYEPVYEKQLGKTKNLVVNKIDDVWNENGLDSCVRVGNKIYEILKGEGIIRRPSTVIAYTRQGRNELYGVPFEGGGKLGNCIYIWCKRNPDTGDYEFLTPEENQIKDSLQIKYFGNATEKQILVKAMIAAGEITQEEAWGVLEEMTNMDNGNFMNFLGELQATLHCQVIRGTFVERKLIGGTKEEELNFDGK